MARIRNIKPEFFDNEVLAQTHLGARLLFIGLWTQADKAGRLEDRPARLKARLFPYDSQIGTEQVQDWLGQLQRGGFIVRYLGATGEPLIQVCNFLKHQYLSKREQDSTLPAPSESQTSLRQVLDESQPSPTDIGHRTTDIGQQTQRVEAAADAEERLAGKALVEAFDRLYALYPNKEGLQKANDVWVNMRPTTDLFARIEQDLQRRLKAGWVQKEARFIPQLKRYLGEAMWREMRAVEPPHVEVTCYQCHCGQLHPGPKKAVCPGGHIYHCAHCGQNHNGEDEDVCLAERRTA